MPKVKVNDIEIYYEIHGEGAPLILIMGFTGNTKWWNPRVIRTLANHFKTIIFDNRGVGQTDKPRTKYSIKLFADDTVGLLDALGLQEEKTNIFGVSMGGMIAQELVLNYPERVDKLILCATNCGVGHMVPPSQEVVMNMSAPTRALTPKEVIEQTIPLLYTDKFIRNNPEFIEKSIQRLSQAPIPQHARGRQLGAIMKFDTWRRLKLIDVPTLIIHGKQDKLVPVGNADILVKRIPGAKKVIFEDAAHGLIQEKADEFTKTVIEFLKN